MKDEEERDKDTAYIFWKAVVWLVNDLLKMKQTREKYFGVKTAGWN